MVILIPPKKHSLSPMIYELMGLIKFVKGTMRPLRLEFGKIPYACKLRSQCSDWLIPQQQPHCEISGPAALKPSDFHAVCRSCVKL